MSRISSRICSAYALFVAFGLVACSDSGGDSSTDPVVDAGEADDDSADDDPGASDDDDSDDDSSDDGADDDFEPGGINVDDDFRGDVDDDAGADDDSSGGDDDTSDDDAGADDDSSGGDDDATNGDMDDDGSSSDDDAVDSGTEDDDVLAEDDDEPARADAGEADASSGAPEPDEWTPCGTPVQVGTFTPEQDDAEGFTMIGETAYLAAGEDGLYVLDLSNADSPTEIGRYELTGAATHRVAAEGDLIALGLSEDGWLLLDGSDLGSITFLSEDDAVEVEDIALAGDLLYFTGDDGLESVDISDPVNPVPLSTDLVLPGEGRQLIVDGETLYVASLNAGISIVDASVPQELKELGYLEVGTAGTFQIALGDGVLYASHGAGVTVIDVTNAEAPVAIEEYERVGTSEVTLLGPHLFVFGEDTPIANVPFVSVVNVSDPTELVSEGTDFDMYREPEFARAYGELLLASVSSNGMLVVMEACPGL